VDAAELEPVHGSFCNGDMLQLAKRYIDLNLLPAIYRQRIKDVAAVFVDAFIWR
jgi:hypothetical protein